MMWAAAAAVVLGLVLIGGLGVYAFHISKALGEADAEIETLLGRAEWLTQALRARGASDSDLAGLVLPVPGDDDPAA